MIVKNEAGQIESCLKSIRPYVDEIVIVDTGSTDGTVDLVRTYCDKFEVFTECNNADGLIRDFSMARQRSFDLASHDWVMWLDGDDEVRNAHLIPSYLNSIAHNSGPQFTMFPYEYAHDDDGNITCLHYRERIMYPRSACKWKNPVHEIVDVQAPNAIQHKNSDIVVVHRRAQSGKKIENNRNLRILQEYYKTHHESDVRQLYYLALEYGNAGDIGNAIKFHKRYMELSGWDDEKFMSCMRVVSHYQAIGDYDSAVDWALRSLTIREGWAESYFSLAKSFYFMAQRGGPQERRNWEKCVHYSNLGLSLPPTDTTLFVNPLERTFEIHRYLNMAYSKLGRVKEALQSATTGLSVRPNDEALKLNVRIFKEFLLKKSIRDSLDELVVAGALGTPVRSFISSLLDSPASEPLPIVPPPDPVETPIVSPVSNVVELPPKPKTSHPRDIALFVGYSPEPWTPETITETGIGGSETMAWEMSRELAAMGHHVRLFGDCQGKEGTYGGVEFLHYDKFPGMSAEILISSRRSTIFDDAYNAKSKLNLCWIHDVNCGDALNHSRALRIDKFLTLSSWHRDHFLNTYNFVHPDQVLVTRNGINLDRFNPKIPVLRNRHRAVYSSSPDRGLQAALESWHLVRAAVPDAELHVYYGFENWLTSCKAHNNTDQLRIIHHLQKLLDDTKHLGVINHGRVGQTELAREFMASGVWAYPTWFSETSCISAMEAQAAGLRIVTSPIAALNETVGDRGDMITGDWLAPDYQKRWTDKVIAAMLADDSDGVRDRNHHYAFENFGFESLAVKWDQMFQEVYEEVERNVVPPYKAVS